MGIPLPEVIAIDPGSKRSGIVFVSAEGKLLQATYLANRDLLDSLKDLEGSLVIEQLQHYGNKMGRDLLDTSYWIGQMVRYASDHSRLTIYLVPRIEVRRQVASGGKVADVNDSVIRSYLFQRFGKQTLTGVNPHCLQALALAVIFLDLARPYREQYRENVYVGHP